MRSQCAIFYSWKKTLIFIFLLAVCCIGCLKKEINHAEECPADTISVVDFPRNFSIVHAVDTDSLFVSISDSLINASLQVSKDSVLSVGYLLKSYFKGIPFRFTKPGDTLADIKIEHLKLRIGCYFSSTGGCTTKGLLEISIHLFRDWQHALPPDYSEQSGNGVMWYLIQAGITGGINFSEPKSSVRNKSMSKNEKSETHLRVNFYLNSTCPVIAFESEAWNDTQDNNFFKKTIEFYSAGNQLNQILSVPLEFTVKYSDAALMEHIDRAPGSFEIVGGDIGNPAHIKIYRMIIRDQDTVSNMVEENYWQGKIYAIKSREELLRK